MADNRRFKGRSSIDIGGIMGAIGGAMGGGENIPVYGADGTTITGFKPKSKTGSALMGDFGVNARDATNNLLLDNQQMSSQMSARLAGQQALSAFTANLNQKAKDEALTGWGKAYVETDKNPGDLPYDLIDAGTQAQARFGSLLDEGLTSARLKEAGYAAQIPFAGLAGLEKQDAERAALGLTEQKARVDTELYEQMANAGLKQAVNTAGLTNAQITDTFAKTKLTEQNIEDLKHASKRMAMTPITVPRFGLNPETGIRTIYEDGVNEFGEPTGKTRIRNLNNAGTEEVYEKPTPKVTLQGSGSQVAPKNRQGTAGIATATAGTVPTKEPTIENYATQEEIALLSQYSSSSLLADSYKNQQLIAKIKSRFPGTINNGRPLGLFGK